MALDVYWKTGKAETWIGSLEIDNALEKLLYQFGQDAGVLIDPYGKGRLYLNQWERLTSQAWISGYPAQRLVDIKSRIPADQPEGIIVIYGD